MELTEEKHLADWQRAEDQPRALIEELNELRAALKERTVQLEAANKELESFSYSVSHDLRAPIRHIHGFVGLLNKSAGSELSPQSQRYLDTISRAAIKMGRLIDALLMYSRIGRAEMRQCNVDLQDLLEETVRALQPETEGRQIRWKKGRLPEVQADPSLLRQVFINLISNAIKYTRPRQSAEIEIGCEEEKGREIVIFVRDNGVGFNQEHALKLFGVFQRLHSEEEFEGTGVGLASVYRIITRHGGRTWAEGKVGQGAAFYFSLPGR
jgi:light-regulated signal transduction histidine kinase (bacteriophytochrome)